MLNNKIIRLAKKENLEFCSVLFPGGVTAARFQFSDYEKYYCYLSLFRKKGFVTENNFYCLSFDVFVQEEKEKLIELNNCKIFLSDLFFLELRKGKTPDQAKKAQEQYCLENPAYKKAFDIIYN